MKGIRFAVPLLAGVALLSFIIGMMVSSSLRITPGLSALGKEALAENDAGPVKDQQVFVSLAAKLMPATVNISTTTTPKRKRGSYHNFQGDENLRDFFGDDFMSVFW